MNLKHFRLALRDKIKEQNLTLNTLSTLSDLSEDTLRSIIYGKAKDIKLSSLVKIADVLDCSIDELVKRNYSSYETFEITKQLDPLPYKSKQFIKTLISLENNILIKKKTENKDYIPLLIPKGNFHDGMFYNGLLYNSLDITNYPVPLKNESSFGILIQTNIFEPIYYQNEILLVAINNIPRPFDIVLYADSDGILYIRRYTDLGLEPLGHFGEIIPINDTRDYIALGVVIKSIYEFDVEQFR